MSNLRAELEQRVAHAIWEHLAVGKSLAELEVLPEIEGFVAKWLAKLLDQYGEIHDGARDAFLTILSAIGLPFAAAPSREQRKALAAHVANAPNKAILFAMLNNKSYDHIIWKMIEPHWVPAKTTSEEES